MIGTLKNPWMYATLLRKLGTFAAIVILIMGISIISNILILNFSLGGFRVISESDSKCYDFQLAFEYEVECFKALIRDRSGEEFMELIKKPGGIPEIEVVGAERQGGEEEMGLDASSYSRGGDPRLSGGPL